MIDPPRHEWEPGLRVLDLPDEFLETPRGGDTQPRVVVHGRLVLVTMPVLVPQEAGVGLLRLIITPTALITVEEKTLPPIDGVAAELLTRGP